MTPTTERSMRDHYHILNGYAISVGNRYCKTNLPGSVRIIVGMHTHITKPLWDSLTSPPSPLPFTGCDAYVFANAR